MFKANCGNIECTHKHRSWLAAKNCAEKLARSLGKNINKGYVKEYK